MELNLKLNFEFKTRKTFYQTYKRVLLNLENVIGGQETISKLRFNCLWYFFLRDSCTAKFTKPMI